MKNWTAIKKSDVLYEIYLNELDLNQCEDSFWNIIKINPEIWKCRDVIEDNFWIVAKYNNYIIWYNDIVESFNLSKFVLEGEILQYSASKYSLNEILKLLKKMNI